MLTITRYCPAHQADWDRFVAAAKNSVFLFARGYMDYHADRFVDHSLLIHRDGRLVAVLPASLHEGEGEGKGQTLISHGGLTFGGIVSDAGMTATRMVTLFEELGRSLREMGISRLLYKAVPHIYHDMPAEEDRYALFRTGARLYRRDLTFTIALPRRPPFQERRRRGANKARASQLVVRQSTDLEAFWPILEVNLQQRHGVRPVHSLAEIRLLRQRFPDNIKLFAAYRGDALFAGVLIYENRRVAHAQYISAGPEGKQLGALDLVFDHLISEAYRGHDYFDFGISTEEQGRVLNIGLSEQKEGFGGRAVVHDFYEWSLAAA
jgi:hypothetical protein